MRHQMLSCIISQRHRWGMGCRSGFMYQGSFFCLGSRGSAHIENWICFSSPWIPLIHSGSPNSTEESPQWALPAQQLQVGECLRLCYTALKMWHFSAPTVIPHNFSAAVAWPWCDPQSLTGLLCCSLAQSMRTNTQIYSNQVWRLQRLVRQKEAGRKGRKRWAVWLCGDQERSCKRLQSFGRRHCTGSSARKRSVLQTPWHLFFVEKWMNWFNALLFRRWLVLFAVFQVIKNGNTKNEINFPDSLHQWLKGNKYFHILFLAGV